MDVPWQHSRARVWSWSQRRGASAKEVLGVGGDKLRGVGVWGVGVRGLGFREGSGFRGLGLGFGPGVRA